MSADFWAGYLSGAAGILIGNPLDLLKTRLQAGGDSGVLSPSSSPRRTWTSNFDSAGALVRGKSFETFLIFSPSKCPAEDGRAFPLRF